MKKFWLLFFLGLVLRLALIPVSVHPDFRAVNLAAYFISQKGELFSFYDHISRLPRTDHLVQLYGDNLFIYPPPAYLIHALFNKLFYPFYPQNAFWILINDIGQLRHTAGFAALMYWLKLPYLVTDILCFYLLFRYLPKVKRYQLIWLWWFNPVVIYTCYLVGQFDIFVALFMILAVITLKKPLLSSVMLGLGAGFKPFSLLLLPLLPGNKIKNLIAGLGTYFLLIAPYLGSAAFRQYALLASQSDKMLFAKIMISGSQYLPLFILGLILVYWWNYFSPGKMSGWAWLSLPLLLFFGLTNYHPQWFVWLMPFLVFSYIFNPKTRRPWLVLLACYFTVILLFEPSLNFGLFGWSFRFDLPVSRFITPDMLASIIRAIFAASAAAVVIPAACAKNG
jgi:hypothetical protein